jgi:outer membrane protein assembly complex protein YaeT
MKKRWPRRAITALAAVFIVLVLILALLHTPRGGHFVLDQLRGWLNSSAGLDLQAATVTLNMLKGSVRLKNVSVRATHTPELPPVFEAATVYARLGILDAVRRSWVVREVSIDRPEVYYFVGPDGEKNIPGPGTDPDTGSGVLPDILIIHADITDGSFLYHDAKRALSINLPRWLLSMEGDETTRGHALTFSSRQEASVEYQAKVIPVSSLELSGILQASALQVESARIVTGGSVISAYGSLTDFSRPSVELEFIHELDLGEFAPIAGIEGKISGTIAGIISASGDFDNLALNTRMIGSNMDLPVFSPAAFDLDASAGWHAREGKLVIHTLDLTTSEGSVSGSAELFPGGDDGVNTIDAHIQHLNIQPIMSQLETPVILASRADATLSIRWEGDFNPAGITGNARIDLAAARSAPELNLLPVSASITAHTQNDRIEGQFNSVNALGANAGGTFSLRSLNEIGASLRGNSSDIDRILEQLALFLGKPEGLLGNMTVAGPIDFTAQVSGTLNEPKIDVSLEAPSIEAAGLKHLSAKAAVVIGDSRVSFENTFTLPHDASIAVKGEVTYGEQGTWLTVDAVSSPVPLISLREMSGMDIPVEGEVMLEASLRGQADNLTGDATVTGGSLSLYGEPLGSLDAAIRLSDNELSTTRFQISRNPSDPSTDRLDADLAYHLDSGHFRMRVSGSDLSLTQNERLEERPLRGNVDLLISGEGTFEHPSIDVNIDADDLLLWGKSLGPSSVAATLRNDELDVDASAPDFSVSSRLRMSLATPYPFTGTLTAKQSDLFLLDLKWREEELLTGSADIEVTVSGTFEELPEAIGSATINSLVLQSGETIVSTVAPALMDYRNRTIELSSPITFEGIGSMIELSGSIPVAETAPPGAITLKGRIDLKEAAAFALQPEAYGLEGNLILDFSISGSPDYFESTGTFSLDDGVVSIEEMPIPVTDLSLRAEVRDGALIVQRADATWGEGGISLTGEFPFGLLPDEIPLRFQRKDGPAYFVLEMNNIVPEQTGLVPTDITGAISLVAAGQFHEIDPRGLTAQVVFRDLSLKMDNLDFSQKEPSLIEVHDGVASIIKLSLTGPQTNINALGFAGLFADAPLDLRIAGDLDAGILAIGSPDLNAAGRVKVEVNVSGSLQAPTLSGYAETSDTMLSLRNPRIIIDGLNMRLDLTSDQITVRELSATLNGGTVDVGGSIGYKNGFLDDINLNVNVRDIFINLPEGLKSSSSGTITITSPEDTILIGGNLLITESSYRESIEIGGQLVSYLRSQQVVEPTHEANPLVERIRFNISVQTITPLQVQNNLARLEAETGNLRLVNTVAEPSLVGRVTLNEGGEIILNQQTYFIRQGFITLVNQHRIEPELNIQAETRVGSYDITLQILGSPDSMTTILNSDPPLPERDILSLLLTGKTVAEIEGREMQMARTQALSLIAGQAGEELTREARRALHLSTFRIDPGQIASESDPGARLTIGEDVTNRLSLIYSMNLMNGGDQIWAAQYNILRRLTTQATKQQDNTYRFEFRHDHRFGNPGRDRTPGRDIARFTIGFIQLEGGTTFSEDTLLRRLRARPGDRYDFSRIQQGMDRLQKFYFDQNRLEANIRMQRETEERTVNLRLNIDPGPVVEFSYEGYSIPRRVRRDVENAWADGIFEIERIDEAVMVIRRAMTRDRYLEAQIIADIEMSPDHKKVHFHIIPGTRYSIVPVRFPGASEIRPETLEDLLDAADLRTDIVVDPRKVSEFYTRYYRNRGFLQAEVELPQLKLDAASGRGEVHVPIKEGPLFTIGELEFSGNTALSYVQLWRVIPTSSGSMYNPDSLRDSARAMESLYYSRGYNDVTVTYRVVQNTEKAHADVAFLINERRQSIIGDIVIEGNVGTSRDFVARQLDFEVGDVLDFQKINETRRRLFSTGIYTSVDFQAEEIEPVNPDHHEKNMRLQVIVHEAQPYRLQYGLFYDTERSIGGLVEAQNLNVLGRASNLGLRLRYDSDLREARLYYHQPYVTRLHIKMDASAFIQQETRPAFTAQRIGFSVFREQQLPRQYRLDYGYRYDHVRWEGIPPETVIFQTSVPVARLIGTIARDTRDSVLDATRGEFTSHSFELGPRMLGSEIGFSRYSGQYFRYVALDRFLGMSTTDREGVPIPPRLVYAGAMRLGLTSAFGGGSVVSPERFFAGGGTTMRGFKQDGLGPMETLDDGTLRPSGGESLFLFNNEIRFPIVSLFHGAGFLDIGNVYPKLSDFNFTVRKTAGVGLRLKLGFIPLRFDYGFKLDRRPGESAGEFFFSVGQAF